MQGQKSALKQWFLLAAKFALRRAKLALQAKLPAGNWGEFNFAVAKQQFSNEVISLPPLCGNLTDDKSTNLGYAYREVD